MNESGNTPMMPSAGSPGVGGWFQVWMKAVTKPSEQTFAEIISGPEATTQNTFIWAAIAGLVNGLGSGIAAAISMVIQGADLQSSAPMLLGFLCGFPIAFIILLPISLAISAGLTQWVAKMFGGSGSFDKLAYAFAAILVPIGVVSALMNLLGAIPFVGICVRIFSGIVGLYGLYLYIAATKAVNRFDWGKAIGSVLIPTVVLGLCACVIVFGLAAAGVGLGSLSSFGNGQFSP